MKKCRQITALISQRADRPLTRSERLALRLHLMICPTAANTPARLSWCSMR